MSTISEPPEIRYFAFETLEITQFSQRVFLRIIIELVFRILKSLVLVIAFMLQPLQGFLTDYLIKSHDFLHFSINTRMRRTRDELPTRGALGKPEGNPRPHISCL